MERPDPLDRLEITPPRGFVPEAVAAVAAVAGEQAAAAVTVLSAAVAVLAAVAAAVAKAARKTLQTEPERADPLDHSQRVEPEDRDEEPVEMAARAETERVPSERGGFPRAVLTCRRRSFSAVAAEMQARAETVEPVEPVGRPS
jgi:hypothetical protein